MRRLLVLAAVLAPIAAWAQEAPRLWNLTLWPGAAMLTETYRDADQQITPVRSLQCSRTGPGQVVVRRYFEPGQARPPKAKRCGIGCQFDLASGKSEKPRRPAAVVETREDYRAVRRELQQYARARLSVLSVAPSTGPNAPTPQLKAFAAACRLPDPDAPFSARWFNIDTPWTATAAGKRLGRPPITTGGETIAMVLTPYILSEPSVLHVQMPVSLGKLGVAIRDADGGLLSADMVRTPASADDIYLSYEPHKGPASLVVQNAGGPGEPTAAEVRVVEFVRRSTLSPADVEDLKLAGLR